MNSEQIAKCYDDGYDDGWNEALDALTDRLRNADETLGVMADQHPPDITVTRLRAKAEGVRLALDYARAMRRSQ